MSADVTMLKNTCGEYYINGNLITGNNILIPEIDIVTTMEIF